jgi:Na+/H+-dicarboxylate symporter
MNDYGINVRIPSWITPASIVSVVAGFALGLVAIGIPGTGADRLASALLPLGQAWVNALLMVLVPLLVSVLVLAVSTGGGRGAARVGGTTVALFLGYMVFGSALTLLVGPPLIRLLPLDPGIMDAAQTAAVQVPVSAAAAGPSGGGTDWIANLVPANPLRAAVDGDILALVIVSVIFGLGLRKVGDAGRPVTDLLRGVRAATFAVVVWVLMALPVGAFALAFGAAMSGGVAMAGAVAFWVVLVSGVCALFLALLYPITAILGRVRIGEFARAALPAQTVALSSRSSLATLPAMMESARTLRLPESVYGLSLPLAVSTFKANNAVSSLLKLLFLATLFGITLDPLFVLTFIGLRIVLSVATPGIPAGTTMLMFPFYVAVGIPAEAYFLLKAVQSIPDLVFTPLNVTADLSVATVTSNLASSRRGWDSTAGAEATARAQPAHERG